MKLNKELDSKLKRWVKVHDGYIKKNENSDGYIIKKHESDSKYLYANSETRKSWIDNFFKK